MKKFIFLALGSLCLLFTNAVQAQSEVFAGGEIYAEYAGDYSEDCGDDVPYLFTYKFYRDPGGAAFPFPMTRDIILEGRVDRETVVPDFLIPLTLDIATPRGNSINLCLFNVNIVTEGMWYSHAVPVMLPAGFIYKPVYGPSSFRSPENNNVAAGQDFFIQTEINTNCRSLSTGIDSLSFSFGHNTAAKWATEEIVETFCHGQPYNYVLPTYDDDEITITKYDVSGPDQIITGTEVLTDKLTYKLVSLNTADGGGINYETGFSPSQPFPSSTPIVLDKGILSFTPDLPVGEKTFVAAVKFEVTETRKIYELSPDGSTINFKDSTISRTFREMRFIFGRDCNQALPTFEAIDDDANLLLWNATENAWEFDCSVTEMEFRMTQPMLCSSFQLDGNLAIEDKTGLVRLGDDEMYTLHRGVTPGLVLQDLDDGGVIDFDRIEMLNCNDLGTFTRFKVYLTAPLGPGRYVMYPKLSDDSDGNTMISRCGFELPAKDDGKSATFDNIPIYVNTFSTYVYQDEGLPVDYCFPADTPNTVLNALIGQEILSANAAQFTYKWRGNQLAPPDPDKSYEILDDNSSDLGRGIFRIDTTFDPGDFPINPIANLTDRWWTVGLGLDFSYLYQGVEISTGMYCYDEDEDVFVNYFFNPAVSFEDVDLCSHEDWPLISPTIDYTNSNVDLQNVFWGYERSDSVLVRSNPKDVTSPLIKVPKFQTVGGQSNSSSVNDELDVGSFAFGVGKSFNIRSIVQFDNGCSDTLISKAAKQDVLVIIEGDSTICEGDQYMIGNFDEAEDSYFTPENMTYQWYFDGQPIVGEITKTVMIDKEGWYKLEVTKNTKESDCIGADSMRVVIADELEAPEPVCSQITFKDGVVQQRFYWDPVDGAEWYEVRAIDEDDKPVDSIGVSIPTPVWYRSNDLYGIHHKMDGQQLRLLVRGVNGEIGKDADCKYGPIGQAEACDVVIKPVNIFTPNGDGINDLLRFDLLEIYPGSPLQVYNRWGKLVFEDNSYKNDWDGGDLKDGTYFYILDVKDPEGQQGIFKGNFTIVR